MFSKTLKIQGSTFLKGKDKEAFVTTLKKQFDALTVKKVFEDSDECMQEKLQGSKMIIYHTDEYPAFVDGTGKEDFVPSMFVVSQYPKLIGTLILKPDIDIASLKGKVLWSQISNTDKLGEFKKDSIKKLLSNDKKLLAIIAIGCDSQDLKNELEKGVAAYILHKEGDKLWEHGPQKLEPPEEPEDFTQKQETHTQNYEAYSDDEDIDLTMIAPGQKKQNVVKEQKKQAKKPIQTQQQVKQQQHFSDSDDDKPKKLQQQQKKQQVQQQTGGVPTKVMDEYIKEAFLNACKIGINDKQLPIEGQTFLEKYMQAYCKQGIELDFKNSTFQKIGKFLQNMNKDGVIEYKEVKKGGQPAIIKIDRQHELISDWDPTVLKPHKKEDHENDQKHQNQGGYKNNIDVTELYQPTGPIVKIFLKQGQNPKELEPLTKEQYNSLLNQYIKKNFKQEKKIIVVTEEFVDELGLSHQQQDDDEQQQEQKEEKQQERNKNPKNHVTLEMIQKRVEHFMQKSHRIKNNRLNQSELKQGEFKGLQLIAEKQHNQQINRVVGLDQFGFDPQGKNDDIYSFAYVIAKMQEAFHCGIAAHEGGSGKNITKEIILQKNVFDQLPDYCANILKIDPQYIHEQNKLTGNKKKQEGMTRQ